MKNFFKTSWLYIPKILQFILFIAVFLLALRNTQIIMVDFYIAQIELPLIILMMCLLVIGMLFGFLLMLPKVFRLKQALKKTVENNATNNITNNPVNNSTNNL